MQGKRDYRHAKIYKIFDDDGYYYIGSTCQRTLSGRKRAHKHSHQQYSSKCYTHFAKVGWDKLKFTVIDDNLNVENIKELKQKEDALIKSCLEDPLCLNSYRAFLTPEEAVEKDRERARNYSKTHYQEFKLRKKTRASIAWQCPICQKVVQNQYGLKHLKKVHDVHKRPEQSQS